MKILGINTYLHDTAAAVLEDGRITWAVTEERLSRLHKDRRFPHLAIEAALRHAGVRLDQLDAIAFGWNRGGLTPAYTLRTVVDGRLPRSGQMVASALRSIVREVYEGNGSRELLRAFGNAERVPVLHIDHHLAHAWSTYGLSGYDDALVVW